jgi:hypothetical protein
VERNGFEPSGDPGEMTNDDGFEVQRKFLYRSCRIPRLARPEPFSGSMR